MFGAPLTEMARAHEVIALHARGHGLSKDGSGPWSYEVFADDVGALMDITNKLIVISTAFRSDGLYPEILEALAQMPSAAPMIAADVKTMFSRKTGELANRSIDWSASVANIEAPTLLIFADADMMRPEHVVEFYKLLGGGQRDAGLDGSLRKPFRAAPP